MEINRTLNGKLYKLKLVTKNINDLRFNPFNTRIYDLIKTNQDLNNFELTSDGKSLSKIQETIYNRLKRTFDHNDNVEIVESIKADGVQEKMITLPNGLLLSGNNRLSIIKNLIDRNEWKHGDNIEVFEMEENLQKDEILLIELELQNVQSKQLMYDVINNIRRAKQLLDSGEEIKRVQTLTNLKSYSRSYIETFDEAISDLSNFYETENILEKIYEAKIFSLLDLYTSLMNSNKVKKDIKITKSLRNIFFEIIFLTTVPVLDFRFVVNGILKMNEENKHKSLSEFEFVVNSIYGELSDKFVEKINSDVDYNLAEFKKHFGPPLNQANRKFSEHINMMQIEIRSASKSSGINKKNPFEIEVGIVPKTVENIERARTLIKELEEWVK